MENEKVYIGNKVGDYAFLGNIQIFPKDGYWNRVLYASNINQPSYWPNYTYISTGYTTPTIPLQNSEYAFQNLAVSNNGQILLGDSGSQLYLSKNYGRKWYLQTPVGLNNCSNVCLSTDGVYLGASFGLGVYISRNSGETWDVYGIGSQDAIKCSENGQYWITISNGGSRIGYSYSNDYGYTWTWYGYPPIFINVDMSTNGQYIVMGTNGTNDVFISSDYGATFTTKLFQIGYKEAICSADGSIIYVSEQRSGSPYSGRLFRSNNYGVTFSTVYNLSNWLLNLKCSDNGQYVMANKHMGGGTYDLVLSSDYGATWQTLISSVNNTFKSLYMLNPQFP